MGDYLSDGILFPCISLSAALLKRAKEEEQAEKRVFGKRDATDGGGDQRVPKPRSRLENIDERYLAARCLWGLADHMGELPELKQSPAFVEIQRWLEHIEHELNEAENARQNMIAANARNAQPGDSVPAALPEPKTGHVMLSYCWANKPIVNQLKSELSKSGVNTW